MRGSFLGAARRLLHTTLSPDAALLEFSPAQTEERNALLRHIYSKYHDLEGNKSKQMEIVRTGRMFADHWQPFKNRTEEHLSVFTDPEFADRLPNVYTTKPYRISQAMAAKLTASSCRLEGSTVTAAEVQALNKSFPVVSSTLQEEPTGALNDEEFASNGPNLVSRKRTLIEIQEAYYHMVALFFAQGLLLGRKEFRFTLDELLRIHNVLMHPFTERSPGKLRSAPIRVGGFHLACFPFPQELPGLLNMYFDWMGQLDFDETHPFFAACDIFLVTAHLHPFMDGNGRMARLLAALAMAHNGCKPLVLGTVNRQAYSVAVYRAQHYGEFANFYRIVLNHQV